MPEDINNQAEQRRPDTLDVYKRNPLFRLRQKIRWLTPKKKLMLLVLPLLIVVMAAGLYLVLAGPGDPVMRLVDDATLASINNQTLQCGQTYTFRIITDVSTSHSNNNGIVAAGAFFDYNPSVFTNITIDSSNSAYDTKASERVDINNGLIEVIRGKPSPGLNSDNQILAKIKATVNPTFSGNTQIRFYGSQSGDSAELKSVFIENGGKSFEPDYNKAGYDDSLDPKAYNLTVNCNYCAGDVCASDEVCPDGNWDNPDNRCCKATCVKGTELYLLPAEKWVNQGEKLPVKIMMSPNINDAETIRIVIEQTPAGILNISDGDIVLNSQIQAGGATMANISTTGGTVKLTISNYFYSGGSPVELATLNYTAVSEGDVNLNFITDGKKNELGDNDTYVFNAGGDILQSMRGGKYHITKPTVRLCQGTEMTVTPSSNSVDFYLCTEPESNCSISVTDDAGSQPPLRNGSDTTDKREHTFTFQGLEGLDSKIDYLYSIYCKKTNYEELPLNGSFKILAENLLTISDVQATDITANKATISWLTSQPATSWVYLSDRSSPEGSDERVTQHSVVLRGLNPATTYEYYVMSATSVNGQCNSGSQSATCSASSEYSFETKSQRKTPDANLILKVDRDRVCDEWLYCNASVQVLDSKQKPPKWQDVCFSLGKCDALDQGGRCVSIVDEGQDQLGALTYDHPSEVDQIKNLSGYNKIGLKWGESEIIPGYYPYSAMKETGTPVGIANGSFEDGSTRPWKAHNNGIISNFRDGANRVLRIKPNSITGAYSGGRLEKIASAVSNQSTYVISFRAKTDSASMDGQKILVQIGPYGVNKDQYTAFKDPNNIDKTIGYVTLRNYWQEYVLQVEAEVLPASITGPLNITFVRAPRESANDAFYLDNVNMKSVLDAANNYLVARSCRLYPTQNAPACDYYDQQANRDYRGWQGYCVETDPGYPARQFSNQPMCLNWWPVDVIQGESNIFSDEKVAGYTGRKPLYYCLEAEGNAPYYQADIKNVQFPVPDGGSASGGKCGKYLGIYLPDGGNWQEAVTKAPVDDYSNDEINSIQIDWKFARNDRSCTLAKSVNTFFLAKTGDNFYGEQSIECNNAKHCTRIKVTRDEEGVFTLEGKSDGDGHDGTIWSIVAKYNLLEPCNVIAQVVTSEGQTTPWAVRVQEGGWPANDPTNTLGYDYKQDYAPYGAAVPGEPVYDPSAWEKPLYVTPADTTTLQAPYQVRAGSPYGVSGQGNYNKCNFASASNASSGSLFNLFNLELHYVCKITGESCNPITDNCPYYSGIGNRVCLAGSQDKLGQECKTATDCGYGADSQQGLCVGIKLNANQQNNIAGGWQAGQANLSQLFAKSYEIWSWELDKTVTPPVMRYVQKFGTATTTDYEWDITNTGNPPKVTDIWVDNKSDKDFFIISQGSAILKFGSWIDPNQLPMVSYSVAWGDGTVVSESGLRINGRDMTNPHILVHYYKYDPDKCNPDLCTCSASYCSYQPKVTVEDNWGKTGSGTFANEIIVYKDEESMPPAILDVAPNKLVYYDKPPIYTLPYTQSFEVTNANNVGRVLNWTADLINWWQSADYTISPTSGSLGRGESQTVKLTINGSHGLATENYSGTVKIKTTDIDNQQEKDVAVTLAVDKDMVVSPTLLMLRPKKNAISTKPGSVDSKTFAIYNNTDDAVVWTATPTILAGETTSNPADDVDIKPASGTLGPNASATVRVTAGFEAQSTPDSNPYPLNISYSGGYTTDQVTVNVANSGEPAF